MTRRKEGQETKRQIALTAKELFSLKGYAGTSMEDIMLATGASKGSIYYHFKSKDNLFLYLIEQSTNEWIDKWTDLSTQYSNTEQKLYGIALHFVEDFQNPLFKAGEEFVGSQAADPEVLQRLLELMKAPYQIYEQIFEQGKQSGEIIDENTDDLVRIFSGLLGGLGAAYYELDLEQIKRLYRKAVWTFLHGVKKK